MPIAEADAAQARDFLAQRYVALVAKVTAVAALHVRGIYRTDECACCHVAWPCPTIQAIQ